MDAQRRSQSSLPILIGLLLLPVLVGLWPATAGAARRAQTASEPPYLALFMVIDVSASMEGADALNRRWTAARLLIGLLQEGDEVAVSVFSSANGSRPAVRRLRADSSPLTRIGSQADKERLLEDMVAFQGSNPPVGTTDPLAAFTDMASLLPLARSDSKQAIIFLTDGEPYLADWGDPVDQTKRATYVEALLDQVEGLDVPLYAGGLFPGKDCLALSGEAKGGIDLLQRMVGRTAGGRAQCLAQAADLPDFFLRSFGDVANRLYSRPGPDGRMEVTPGQQGVLQDLTLVYVDDLGGCGSTTPTGLCAPITDRTGLPLTRVELENTPDRSILGDAQIELVNLRNPAPGSYILGGQLANWYIVQRTRLRMELGVPEVLTARQPLGQPLEVRVRFWQRRDDGSEQSFIPAEPPLWEEQGIAALSVDQGAFAPLSASLSPSAEAAGVFVGLAPAQSQPGAHLVRVSAVVAGFRFTREQQLQIEPFPTLTFVGPDEAGVLAIARGRPAAVRIEPQREGVLEPVAGLTADNTTLTCDNQILPLTVTQGPGGAYLLGFTPLQQDRSACSLSVDGVLTYGGTAYRSTQPAWSFQVALQPLIELSARETAPAFGSVLAQPLVIAGVEAALFADRSVTLIPRVTGTDAFAVSVSPATLLRGQTTALTITLVPLPQAAFQSYAGTVVLEAAANVIVSGTNELRFTLELVPPSLQIANTAVELATPLLGVEDPDGEVRFQLTSQLTIPQTLAVRPLDAHGAPLDGVIAELTPTEVPVGSSQEYVVHLRSSGTGDPWPVGLFDTRPFSYTLVLDAGPGVVIEPRPAIMVAGERLSIVGAFTKRYAGPLRLGGTLLILASVAGLGLWGFLTIGWLQLERAQASRPHYYLVPVTLERRGPTAPAYEQAINLASLAHNLRHQLFGVRLQGRAGGGQAPRRGLALWPPRAFWGTVLNAGRVDRYLSEPIDLDVRVISRKGRHATQVTLENQGGALQIWRGGGAGTLRRGQKVELREGDVVALDEDRGLMLSKELTPPTRTTESARRVGEETDIVVRRGANDGLTDSSSLVPRRERGDQSEYGEDVTPRRKGEAPGVEQNPRRGDMPARRGRDVIGPGGDQA